MDTVMKVRDYLGDSTGNVIVIGKATRERGESDF